MTDRSEPGGDGKLWGNGGLFASLAGGRAADARQWRRKSVQGNAA